MENHYFQWLNPLQLALFRSYDSLPEGNHFCLYYPFCMLGFPLIRLSSSAWCHHFSSSGPGVTSHCYARLPKFSRKKWTFLLKHHVVENVATSLRRLTREIMPEMPPVLVCSGFMDDLSLVIFLSWIKYDINVDGCGCPSQTQLEDYRHCWRSYASYFYIYFYVLFFLRTCRAANAYQGGIHWVALGDSIRSYNWRDHPMSWLMMTKRARPLDDS